MRERKKRVAGRAQLRLFARNFVRHPKMLGSVLPSSRFLVKQVLDRIDWSRAKVVVEYGPGIGNFTAEILEHLRPDGRLVAIETNAEFAAFLRKALPDARLLVVEGSAAEVRNVLRSAGHHAADYIISGIPFSTMPAESRQTILRQSRAALAPGGAFLVYQFSRRVLRDLRRVFGSVEQQFEPLNFLPARLFFCEATAS